MGDGGEEGGGGGEHGDAGEEAQELQEEEEDGHAQAGGQLNVLWGSNSLFSSIDAENVSSYR